MTVLPTVKDQALRKWLMYGTLMSVLGLGSYYSLDPMVNIAVKSQVNLDPNGQLFPNWLKAPVPVIDKFYIFNIDNPNEVLRGEKPHVSERGPYTFKQWRRKEILEWAKDRSTVKYVEFKKYEFDPENTVGSLNDEVTIINPMVATFGATITRLSQEQLPIPFVFSPFVFGLINIFFAVHSEKLFTTQTVGELILGKRVGMLDTITTLMKPLDWLGIVLEQFPKEALPPNNMFGLLAGRNNTPEGPYVVYTGITGDGDAAKFVSWKDQKKLKLWKSEQCNMINGSDGTLFKPGLTPEDKLYVFAGDLCRSAGLIYERDSEYMGIPSYSYIGDPSFLKGMDKEPFNQCFCTHKDTKKCEIDGLYDLGGCQFGAPLLFTSPHFLFFPHLQRNIDGLSPNEEKHFTRVEIQPTLGAALYAQSRVMFVVRIENNAPISAYKDIKSNYIPLFWLEESGGLNEELANQLLYGFVYPIRGASIATAGTGFAGIATIAAAIIRKRLRRENGKGADYGQNIYENKQEKTAVKNSDESVTKLRENDH